VVPWSCWLVHLPAPSDQGATASNPVAVVASTPARPSGEPSLAPGVGLVSCGWSIDARPDPPNNYRVVARNVAVPTASILQANDPGQTDPAVWLFAKWGLVRAGAAVDLQVGPGWEDRARIGWGSPAPRGAAVHVPACPQQAEGPWLAFPGGTWVAQPACVPLIVRSQGQETQVRLGIGVPCGSGSSP
jgi:hypothetical protein